MRSVFIANLPYFQLDGIDAYEYLQLKISSPNVALLTSIVDLQFMNAFGVIGMNRVQNNWPFAYLVLNDEITDVQAQETFNEYLRQVRHSLHAFDTFLWFLKDNSCNIQHIFAKTNSGKNVGYGVYDTKHLISNCAGDFIDVLFSEIELTRSLEIRNKFFSICPLYLDDEELKEEGKNEQDVERDTTPIERAFNFLRSARTIMYIPAKIAMYMSAFECLFTTNAAEVTQTVSQRVAFYIGETKEERWLIFKRVKEAYDIRSKYVHGAEVHKDYKERATQIKMSQQIDEIARRVFTKVIMTDSDIFLNRAQLEPFLPRLVFQYDSLPTDSPPLS